MILSRSAVAASTFFLISVACASIVFFSAARLCSASFRRDSASFTRRSVSSAFIMTSSWRCSDLATSASALAISCWSARYASLVFTAPLWSRYLRTRSFHSWPSNSNFLRSALIFASASLPDAISERAPLCWASASGRIRGPREEAQFGGPLAAAQSDEESRGAWNAHSITEPRRAFLWRPCEDHDEENAQRKAARMRRPCRQGLVRKALGLKEEGMPHVEITWVEGRSPEQKRKIAERVTAVLIEDGKAKRENIHVCFHDVPAANYAEAGVLVADQKRAP